MLRAALGRCELRRLTPNSILTVYGLLNEAFVTHQGLLTQCTVLGLCTVVFVQCLASLMPCRGRTGVSQCEHEKIKTMSTNNSKEGLAGRSQLKKLGGSNLSTGKSLTSLQ